MKLKRMAAFLTACCVGVMNVPFTVASFPNQLFANAEETISEDSNEISGFCGAEGNVMKQREPLLLVARETCTIIRGKIRGTT